MIDRDYLIEVLAYDEESGVFTWNSARPGIKVGDVAGSFNGNRYWKISIDRKNYMAHRLAWLYVHGDWPRAYIDHIDGCRHNNAINNLRECSGSENQQNKSPNKVGTSKYLGVSWDRGRWRAGIAVNGKNKHLGRFKVEEDAAEAYRLAKQILHSFNPVYSRGRI